MKDSHLDIKVFYNGKKVKVIELKNLKFFFEGMETLSNEWKVKPFVHIWKNISRETYYAAFIIVVGLIYKDMCTKKGWEVNSKRFKNEMLLKNKNPKVFSLKSEYLIIEDHLYGDAFSILEKIGLIVQGSHRSYIRLNDKYSDYCRKLGNYLFDTSYAQKSIKDNRHYFGGHTSFEHEIAARQRKQISERELN